MRIVCFMFPVSLLNGYIIVIIMSVSCTHHGTLWWHNAVFICFNSACLFHAVVIILYLYMEIKLWSEFRNQRDLFQDVDWITFKTKIDNILQKRDIIWTGLCIAEAYSIFYTVIISAWLTRCHNMRFEIEIKPDNKT